MLVRRAVLAAVIVLTAQGALARDARAQGAPGAESAQNYQVTLIPEARLDLLSAPTAVHAGVGVGVPLSNYFLLAGDIAAGISSDGFSGRADGVGRFSLDPYHEYPWEPYVGGGVTVRADAGGRGTRTYLLGVLGVNGPPSGGIVPGLEFGVGGGLRFGVVLRWASTAAQRPR